jgi:putative FmdB family regulatory protein
MPIYEYVCLECGRMFEKLVRTTQNQGELKCPLCGHQRLEEKISAPASLSTEEGCAPKTASAPRGR